MRSWQASTRNQILDRTRWWIIVLFRLISAGVAATQPNFEPPLRDVPKALFLAANAIGWHCTQTIILRSRRVTEPVYARAKDNQGG